jgi:hypothetical protein
MRSRKMKLARNVARMEAKRNAYRILMTKPEGNRPLGRPGHRWEDNIKWILENRMGWYGLD